MGFKEDADFARFVSMGAVGAAAVARHLRDEHGHRPIELERYAMANKVWQTKVKRLRLPDLVCVRCGRRVESRAKSKLGIILSHSDTFGREWHAGGMRDDDLYAFLKADLSQFPPYAGAPAYFTSASLATAVDAAKRSAPKSASEGSEVTLSWPSWVPSKAGSFVGVDAETRVVCRWDDGTIWKYWHWRNWPEPRFTYLAAGDRIHPDETIVAGVVAPAVAIDCPGDVWRLAADIEANDPSDLYAAIKAAGATAGADLSSQLIDIAEDDDRDWRLRIEAFASLARFEPGAWTGRIESFALDHEASPEQQMEATFVLSEIPTDEAATSLAAIAAASDTVGIEVRAAAAWGLGQGSAARPDLLLRTTLDSEHFVALHAITAIQELPDDLIPTLIGWMAGGDDRKGAIAAQLLQRHRKVAALLDACDVNVEARLWALRALGDLPPPLVRLHGGDRLTSAVKEILAPMWHAQTDWLRTEGEDGLEALDVQKVRFDPSNPG